MALSPDYVLKSAPCEVWWSGFKSTTIQLQQAGWEVATHQDVYQGRIGLVMRNRDMRMYAVCDTVHFDFFKYAMMPNKNLLPVFHVTRIVPHVDVVEVMGHQFSAYKQIDAMPSMNQIERKSIEDFGIFNVPLVRTEEIIVDPGEVSDILQKLLEMQSPEQKAIRDRNRGRDRRGEMLEAGPVQKFHAQIISLDSVRAAA